MIGPETQELVGEVKRHFAALVAKREQMNQTLAEFLVTYRYVKDFKLDQFASSDERRKWRKRKEDAEHAYEELIGLLKTPASSTDKNDERKDDALHRKT